MLFGDAEMCFYVVSEVDERLVVEMFESGGHAEALTGYGADWADYAIVVRFGVVI